MRSSLCSRVVVLINSKRLITLALTKVNLSSDNSRPSCPVHTRLCVLRREYRCSSPMPCAHSQRSHSAQTHALASLSCPVHTRLCVLRREYSSGQNFSPDPARSLFSAHPPVPCELVDCDVRVDLVRGAHLSFVRPPRPGVDPVVLRWRGVLGADSPPPLGRVPGSACRFVCASALLSECVPPPAPLYLPVTARRPYGDGPGLRI